MKKKFDEWNEQKKYLERTGGVPSFSERDVWWCAQGVNLGTEINGKNSMFSRPVLFLKKLSRYGFIGIPLTSQKHEGSWWVKFQMNGKNEYAVVAQVEYIDVYRLYTKIGQMSRGDFENVRQGMIDLIK